MTLIELLVVIIILSLLVAAAIPLLAPSTSERQLREAVRGLNAYFGAAQARAIAQARPYGVALRRLSRSTGNSAAGNANNNGVAVEAFMVEQPAPYSGFDQESLVRIASDPTGSGYVFAQFVRTVTPPDPIPGPGPPDMLPPGYEVDTLPPAMIRPGDVLEFNGTRFVFYPGVNSIDPNGYFAPAALGATPERFTLRPINAIGQLIDPVVDNHGQRLLEPPPIGAFELPYWSAACTFRILRQPVPTTDEPYQLPEGTVVDLRASGIGEMQFFHWPDVYDNADDVLVMFTPEGRVERVRYNLSDDPGSPILFDQPVIDNIYLLVGPNVPAPPPPATDKTLTSSGWSSAATDEEKQRLRDPINWLRGDSTWLVIGAATGRIATIENTFVDPLAVFGELLPFSAAAQPSEEMRSNQIVAARRFTKSMEQLGGR
jgi:type II secretory pathway pseudopilin PulG